MTRHANIRIILLLDLGHNRLTGSIPAELGKLRYLEELNLRGNDFSGCVPANLPDIWVTASGLVRCQGE